VEFTASSGMMTYDREDFTNKQYVDTYSVLQFIMGKSTAQGLDNIDNMLEGEARQQVLRSRI
jgi:hypothetical protein